MLEASFLAMILSKLGFTKKESRRFAPFVQYAILASDEAMAQAGIDMEKEDADRFACILVQVLVA